MIQKKINENWKYWADDDSFALIWNVPQDARKVTLPHDAMLEKAAHAGSGNGGNTGYRDGGNYNYVKYLDIPNGYRDKEIQLIFEGVYENAFVYVNGQLAGENHYGYSTFVVNIKDFIEFGERNQIRVAVKNCTMTNSRWYSGGGIYRDVYLAVSGLVHIPFEGVRIDTESADSAYAVLRVSTALKNQGNVRVHTRLETIIRNAEGKEACRDIMPVTLFAGEERKVEQRILVEQPELWTAKSPKLYRAESRLIMDDSVLDKEETVFGIRWLSLDAKRGLRVNGETVKLRGACIHHDSGLLGAATYQEAQYRQIAMLKNAGFNAVRMSHHPMAPAMLRACDEVGMYVMDETFDMWTRGKSDFDYSVHFTECWEKDVASMVSKDYNHPSVILYSVGNEIPEISTDSGVKICHDICAKIKSMDTARYTLASINGIFAAGDDVGTIMRDITAGQEDTGGNVNDFMTVMDERLDDIVVHECITKRLEKACAVTDIAGYNYMTARYEPDGKAYPNRVIVGSETYPPEIARNWELVKKLNHVIGDFTWTGWDYIGEAGVGVPGYRRGEGGFGAAFPCQLAYCGDIDITGVRRPASYYREIVFGLRKEPYIAVQNPYRYGERLIKTPWVISDSIADWTYPGCEGKPVIAEVYAPGTEVELFLNGRSLGRKKAGAEAGYRTLFETTYEPGTLRAAAYDGAEMIGEAELATAGKAKQIVLEQEEPVCQIHSRRELCYIQVSLRDSQGRMVRNQDKKIYLAIQGDAEMLGFGSSNPRPAYNVREGVTETFQGSAQIILKRKNQGSSIKVTVTAEDGMHSAIELL